MNTSLVSLLEAKKTDARDWVLEKVAERGQTYKSLSEEIGCDYWQLKNLVRTDRSCRLELVDAVLKHKATANQSGATA